MSQLVTLAETFRLTVANGGTLLVAYSNKKVQAQILLAQDIPQIKVAQLLKISRKTVWRWLQEDGFKQAVLSGRRTQLESALRRNTPAINDVSEEFKALDDVSKEPEITRDIPLSLSERLISKSFAALDELLSNPEARTSDILKGIQIVFSQCGGGAVGNFGVKQTEQRSQNVDTLIAQRENLRARMKTLESRRALEGEAKVSKSI